jgi:inorganic pyrophosphatase
MSDFNKLLTPGDYQNGTVNTVVEIPEGSILKVEYRRETGTFEIDRVEPSIFPKPASYGFIPGTIDEDNDELDTLIVSPEPIPTGVWLKVTVLGVLKFRDDGEMDYKIIVVPADDRNSGDAIKTLDDLGQRWKQKVEFHFSHYKDLKKPGTTEVLGWGGAEEAKNIIAQCVETYHKKFGAQ